jgi:hypothetical protein
MPAYLQGADRRHVGGCAGRVMSANVRMLEQWQVTRREAEDYDTERNEVQHDCDLNP